LCSRLCSNDDGAGGGAAEVRWGAGQVLGGLDAVHGLDGGGGVGDGGGGGGGGAGAAGEPDHRTEDVLPLAEVDRAGAGWNDERFSAARPLGFCFQLIDPRPERCLVPGFPTEPYEPVGPVERELVHTGMDPIS